MSFEHQNLDFPIFGLTVGFDHISGYRMSGLPVVSLDEKIESIVIPSFDGDRELKKGRNG
jgi:hypothetical protein